VKNKCTKPLKADLNVLPRIKVRFLWHNNWWDGPLAGMCEYKDQMYWYALHHENYGKNAKYWRRYVVVKLTPEQLAEELKWHKLFIEKVGDHFDCDERGHRKRSELKPYHRHHEFYDEFDKIKDTLRGYEEKPEMAIGWFEIGKRTTV
jgi:hypothetical protein